MTARYTESKEHSAELLRAALRCMGQHDARCNPVSFTVWYEYSAGINAQLNLALDQCLRSEPRLTTPCAACTTRTSPTPTRTQCTKSAMPCSR